MKKIFLFTIPFLILACSSDDEKKVVEIPQAPLVQGINGQEFNTKFDTLLNHYYTLKNAFVKEDTNAIFINAKLLMKAADSLPVNAIKGDTTLIETAKNYAQTISDETKGLLGEKNIEEKRKSFEMISDNLMQLTRTVQYNIAVVYMFKCNKANNNKGAIWLSNAIAIQNPYLPKEVGECCEIKDSIDYRVK